MNGFILESKSIIDSEIWNRPPLYFKVWHYLLLNAQFQDYKGLKRGQIRTSIPEIQEAMAYKIGFRTVKPTYNEIRDVIDFLKSGCSTKHTMKHTTKHSMITTTKTTRGFIATICNYNKYQDIKSYEAHNGNQHEAHNGNQYDTANDKERRYKEDITKKNHYYKGQRLMSWKEIDENLKDDPDYQEYLKENKNRKHYE